MSKCDCKVILQSANWFDIAAATKDSCLVLLGSNNFIEPTTRAWEEPPKGEISYCFYHQPPDVGSEKTTRRKDARSGMGSDGPPPSSGKRCGRSGGSEEPGSGHSPNAKRRAYDFHDRPYSQPAGIERVRHV